VRFRIARLAEQLGKKGNAVEVQTFGYFSLCHFDEGGHHVIEVDQIVAHATSRQGAFPGGDQRNMSAHMQLASLTALDYASLELRCQLFVRSVVASEKD